MSLLLLTGCHSRPTVELPGLAIHEDTRAVAYWDVAAANPEQVAATLDALYRAVPDDEHAQRLRLMFDGLRGEADHHYRRLHNAFDHVGLRTVVFVWHAPDADRPDVQVFVQARDETSPEELTLLIREEVSMPIRIDDLASLEEGWFVFGERGAATSRGGEAEHARTWGEYLADAGPGPLRMVARLDAASMLELDYATQGLSTVMSSRKLTHRARELLPELDRVSLALELGDSPAIRLRQWYTDDQAAEQARIIHRDLLERASSRSKLYLAVSDLDAPPAPEAINELVAGLTPVRQRHRLDITLDERYVGRSLDVLAALPISRQMQSDFVRELQWMLRNR